MFFFYFQYMEILEIKKSVKSVPKFECSHCDFKCCTKSDLDRHTLRAKHIFNVNGNKMEIKKSVKSVKSVKKYNTNSGLWKHQSKCDNISSNGTIYIINDLSSVNKHWKPMVHPL
jgi:hypothetical protein